MAPNADKTELWTTEVETFSPGSSLHPLLRSIFATPANLPLVAVCQRQLKPPPPGDFLLEIIGLPAGQRGRLMRFGITTDGEILAVSAWRIRAHARGNPGYAEWAWQGGNVGESRLVFPKYADKEFRPTDDQVLEIRKAFDYLRNVDRFGDVGRPAGDTKAADPVGQIRNTFYTYKGQKGWAPGAHHVAANLDPPVTIKTLRKYLRDHAGDFEPEILEALESKRARKTYPKNLMEINGNLSDGERGRR